MQTSKQRSIAVIGLGFVGLPLCQLFLQNGYTVHGIDVDEAKLKNISQGYSNNPDVDNSYLTQCVNENRFYLHETGKGVTDAEAILICVPTPLTNKGEPDLKFVNKAITNIMPYLKPYQLISLESTTYPGTTEELILPKLKEKGFQVGDDIFLAYSPERINPGSDIPLSEIPKVVGGMTPNCLEKASLIYQSVFDEVCKVSSTRAAEMTKILENTQRFINISFINDFAILCGKMDIDVHEVIDAASTKPYGFTRYTPGAGIGGHCIPIDPMYLSWKAKEYNHETPFIKIADEINKLMPTYVANKIKDYLLAKANKPSPSVLLIGVAYKKDVNDVRESSALPIMKYLLADGIQVDYFDSYVPSVYVDSKEYHSINETSLPSSNYDVAIVLTEHSNIPYEKIFSFVSDVIDLRHLFFHTSNDPKKNRNRNKDV
ncbi:nucleotide sugar dehydrogenase [Bacillus solitudinis]|uniref:nucleotide sugar dehydrogenase n=1 Tax=Bacillus solitudinis TaxID=2014074 RepID=UPI000C233180|nr:nucleotide sugar dehydrogenase [Bacillus solitudinis]